MNALIRDWADKHSYDATFWLIHVVGCTAVFWLGMRTATKVALPIAVCRMVRRILAK